MTAPLRLMLPYPPSTNDLWCVRGGRIVRTEAYRSWREGAAWAVALGRRRQAITGPYDLQLRVVRPSRRFDLDNTLKPRCDALQAGGAISNDCLAERITLAWDAEVETVEALIMPAGGRV